MLLRIEENCDIEEESSTRSKKPNK